MLPAARIEYAFIFAYRSEESETLVDAKRICPRTGSGNREARPSRKPWLAASGSVGVSHPRREPLSMYPTGARDND
jgi:hypothetical protein